MARPRNQETDDVIELLARHNTVDQVAELLEMDRRQVQRLYATYYSDVTIKMREYDRQEKAADISALIREGRAKREAEVEPVAVEPEPVPAAEPEPEPVQYADGLETSPQVARAAEEKRSSRLPNGTATVDTEEAPAYGPLRVHGYIGECGRTYILQGRTVEIDGLAQRYTKEDLRRLVSELLEMARIMDKLDGMSA